MTPPPSWVERGYSVVRQLQRSPVSVYVIRHDPTSTASTSSTDDAKNETSGESKEFVAKIVQLEHLGEKDRVSAQQELSVLKSLHHTNVVAYHDSWEEACSNCFVTGPHLVMVMELARDGDLRIPKEEAIDSGLTGLNPETVIFWGRQLLLGLQYIHHVRLVHRDLKSANVFLTDNRTRCLVGDFGISKVLESTLFATTCVGTPAYMAPEIVRNDKYSSSVDMWAFGVILYELLTLQLPFSSPNLLGLVYQIATQDPDFTKLEGVDPALAVVVKDCLRKAPDSRPCADTLLTQCHIFVENGVPVIPPPAPEPVTVKPSFSASLPRPKGVTGKTGASLAPLLATGTVDMLLESTTDGDERLRLALLEARMQQRHLSSEDLGRLFDPVASGTVNEAAAIEAKVNIFLQRRSRAS